MNRATFISAALILPALLLAQDKATVPQGAAKSFPGPDFTLSDNDVKPQEPRVVLGPIESDGNGGSKGSGAFYAGTPQSVVISLSFSGNGKILAVGSTPGRVDLWDVEGQKKLSTLEGGSAVALSSDGHLVAIARNDIELRDVATGNLNQKIPWPLKTSKYGAQNTIFQLTFNPDGTLLDVTANGEDDSVYDVSSGKLLATLTNTEEGQFSRDGALLIGGNAKHLIVWSTKDWSKVSDLPNGPDYVMAIAALPEKDLVVVAGAQSARLLRLSTGGEIATVGTGYINFAAFDQTGTLIFTDPSSGFAVWNTSGTQYCSRPNLGDGIVAVSANNKWLASSPDGGGTAVTIWNLQNALNGCGVPASLGAH